MKQMVKVNIVDLYEDLWVFNAHEEVKDLIKHTCMMIVGRKHGHVPIAKLVAPPR